MRYREIGDGRLSLTVSDLCLGIMYIGLRARLVRVGVDTRRGRRSW